ncbi:MAG: sugar phosphate isomerase/epimerase [candidate division KSB1 bacterium]|nr:sugar phosphate isomerase/epimerase [candidate division KSB1 bacterium]MDZ7367559.1 sugar phosphate isomerase/epimerase [candidate division KSB1 bacterium]MDZ7404884.1 sugar phosphate isomerase/epimerase [candidate division KSB1 bacterium]
MRIGIVTDEISTEVREAIELGMSWGIMDYELRVIGEARVPTVKPETVDDLLRLKEKFRVRYTALSPGACKGAIDDDETLQRELNETLPETFRLARKLDVPTVIIFGFQRLPQQPSSLLPKVVEAFCQMAIMAQKEGLRLAVENEPGFWCDSGQNTARLIAAVDSPFLRANWDPANALGTDEIPYPDGYEAIKKWIANVHVKDTIKGALIECVPVGEGKIDWEGQLRALIQDRAIQHITIETHCPPLRENSQKNLQRLQQMLRRLHTRELDPAGGDFAFIPHSRE